MTEKQKLKEQVTKNWHPKAIEAILETDEDLFKHCRILIKEYRRMLRVAGKKASELIDIIE